ncbi:MAG: hypothetical protein ACOYBY_13505 [Dermatophilaceae bacterium]
MIVECSTCPVRGQRCQDCLVTAMEAVPVVGSPGVGLALDAAERRAVGAFVEAGLIGGPYAAALRARGQPPTWWAKVSG